MAKRSPVLILTASAALAVSLSGMTSSKAQSPRVAPSEVSNGSVPKKAEEQFKNIQVLKGIPADELIPTMQFITASLGVECEFCHVPKAFEKDDKKSKETARKMMEMMFAINKDNFEGHREVTCYSCHRGSANPVAIPAVMTEEVPDQVHRREEIAKEEGATGSSLPAPDQLLDKYIQAVGGTNAVDKTMTRVMKGNIDFGGKSIPIDIYCKSPEQRISFMHNSEGDSVTAFNGQEGWMQNPKGPLHEMHGNELDGASIDADLHLPTHLKQMFREMKVLRGKEKIGGRDTYDLVGSREGKPPIHLYFDEQSGLLLRLIRYGDTALGWLPTQIDYDDYREAEGVKVPYRWTLARPGGRFTIRINELHQNVQVDAAKFVKPTSQQQSPPAK